MCGRVPRGLWDCAADALFARASHCAITGRAVPSSCHRDRGWSGSQPRVPAQRENTVVCHSAVSRGLTAVLRRPTAVSGQPTALNVFVHNRCADS